MVRCQISAASWSSGWPVGRVMPRSPARAHIIGTALSTSELADVYQDIGSQISFETIKDEISPSYTAIGLILLTLSAAMSLLWFSRLP